MNVFQRRLASSTYALLCSLERRLARLEGLIDDIRSGRLTMEQLLAMQRGLEAVSDPLDEMTADEESVEDGREENEASEEQVLAGVVAVTLADLENERLQVKRLVELARQVNDREQSKFEKLREVRRDPQVIAGPSRMYGAMFEHQQEAGEMRITIVWTIPPKQAQYRRAADRENLLVETPASESDEADSKSEHRSALRHKTGIYRGAGSEASIRTG
jgi:hypothetical protein